MDPNEVVKNINYAVENGIGCCSDVTNLYWWLGIGGFPPCESLSPAAAVKFSDLAAKIERSRRDREVPVC